MRERKPTRLLVSLAFVALTGLAVSCGEEPSSGNQDAKPPKKAESAQAPAATKPADKEKKAEVTEAKKPEAKKPEAKKPGVEEKTTAAVDPAGIGADRQGGQYELPSPAGEGQYDTATNGALPAPQSAPTGSTMYLSVPGMGVSGVPVVDGYGEGALEAGTQHVPGTGFPWQGVGSNTYIAGHRLGYPGTPSDHVFYNLPNLAVGDSVSLTDENGTTYNYAVSEIMEVSPTDLWVTSPVAGRDVVTLQTCIENFGDYWTPGPDWLARYVVRADRV